MRLKIFKTIKFESPDICQKPAQSGRKQALKPRLKTSLLIKFQLTWTHSQKLLNTWGNKSLWTRQQKQKTAESDSWKPTDDEIIKNSILYKYVMYIKRNKREDWK